MTKREPSKKSTDKPPASRRKAEKPDLSHIAEGLRPLATPISKVKPDPKNARKHSDRNIAAIANSLARFGQVQPIVVNKLNSIVVAGNGRLTAAKSLEWTHIAVLYVELDPISQTGYALADNRTAEMAEWDEAMLAQAFEDIKAIDSALAHDLCIEELLAAGLPAGDFQDGFEEQNTHENVERSTRIRVGAFTVDVTLEAYEAWESRVKAKVGPNEEAIRKEILSQLSISPT